MIAVSAQQERVWRRRRPYGTTSGVLLATSGLPAVVSQWMYGSLGLLPAWHLAAVALVSGALLAGGLVIPRRPSSGRALATLGTAGLLVLVGPFLAARPFWALSMILLATALLGRLWNVGGPPAGPLRPRGRLLESRARGAALGALGLWITLSLAGRDPTAEELWATGFALCVAAGMGLAWALLERRRHPRRAALHAVALLGAGAVVGAADGGNLPRVLDAAAVVVVVVALVLPGSTGGWEILLGHRERLLGGTFAALCIAGTLGLALPHSAVGSTGVALLDAAFTAVSAVCVTGLIVLDTPHDFSLFGQAMILLLIQLGGLGIMTFSTAALRLLGGRVSLRYEGAAAALVSERDRGRMVEAAQRILWVTFSAEAAGTVVLAARFLAHGDPLGTALWRGLFTAVSAFCNAGFALQSDSLVGYQADPWVLHCVALLIVAGGLAPPVLVALPACVRRGGRPVEAQIKLSLVAAGVLLMAGFVLLLAFEWDGALADLAPLDRLHNAWFQSVTLRTAGFNSIDLAQVQPVSISLMLIWMFIGGGPGGTAGGIKTTTAAVLALAVLATMRGHWEVTTFGRRVAPRTLQKAVVVTALGAATVLAAILSLQLTQDLEQRELIFEVFSAVGTVGLSLGATAELDAVGKLIVIACMFAGRVGPLTLLLFLSHRQARLNVKWPEEDIDVG